MIGMSVLCGVPGTSFGAESGWPGLRGPSHDGAVRNARLFAGGDRAALALGWKRALGSGYSSVAAGDGRVVTMFASGDADVAAAFDAADGSELWRYRIGDAYKGHDGSHDGPISSPWLSGGRVYGLGPNGHLFALDAASGKVIWTKNLTEDLSAQKPHYGFATSPLLVDRVLVVEIGAGQGKAIAGFHPDDGRMLWSVGDDIISYHSPIAATIGGRVQVLAAGNKTLFGLDAASGKVLWSYAHQGDESPTGGETIVPVPAGDNRFLLLNKSDSSSMIRVTQSRGGAYEVSELWSSNSIRGTYVIPVYHDGHVYGMNGHIFTCVDAATGEIKWRSREAGDGFPTLVGGHLVIMTKPGTLGVAEASPTGYHEVARLDLFDEQSWSAVAYADGHLYARSMAHLARVDLVAGAVEPGGSQSWIAATEFGRFLDEAGKASDKVAVIDAFLAKQKSFPIVEDTGAVHFLYRGKATDVGIVGDMIGFRREDPMTQLADTDLFHYSTRLEPDAAITYGFIVDYGKPIADPHNARPGRGLFGEVSWFAMPARRRFGFPDEVEPGRQGRLEPLEWESRVREGKKRTAQVYLPAGYDARAERRYPVIYLHDGKDALDQGGMKNALDHLIGATVEPLIAVFVIPDPENTDRDLGQVETYTEMVATELVPKIDERYRTIPRASARAVAGAAGGADAALFGVFKHPEMFARVASQSATMMDAAEYEGVIRSADEQPLVIYMAWGSYHLRSPHEAWDMARSNRDLWALLRKRGYRPAGGEVPEGFGWDCWRGHIDEMLTALFPLRRE